LKELSLQLLHKILTNLKHFFHQMMFLYESLFYTHHLTSVYVDTRSYLASTTLTLCLKKEYMNFWGLEAPLGSLCLLTFCRIHAVYGFEACSISVLLQLMVFNEVTRQLVKRFLSQLGKTNVVCHWGQNTA
jgi:hypothetical protein